MDSFTTLMPSRRALLGGIAGSLTLATALGAKSAVRESPTGEVKTLSQVPAYYRFKLGTAECTVVSDGPMPLGDPAKAFLNITKAEIDRELSEHFLPTDSATLEQNILIVNFGNQVVLFDTGMGTDTLYGATTGRLPRSIAQAGIDPAKVTAVVLSHAHIDHCGGLIDATGNFHFPNAQYYIGEADFTYWTDGVSVPADYPARIPFIRQAQRNLLPLRDRMHFYRDNEQILPGITVLAAPGHTVSHSIFMIEAGGKTMCYTADLAHHPVLLLENPRTQFAYDTDPVLSSESRVRMLTMLAANRIPVLAYHFPWPGLGYISRQGEGFRFFPISEKLGSVTAL